ncbi:MAG: TIGR03013 family XrtA/PEP-CTERM system glycosyltransferase [bacterium]
MIDYMKRHFCRILFLMSSIDFLILLLVATLALRATGKVAPSIFSFILISQIFLFINDLYLFKKKYQIKKMVYKCISSFACVSVGYYILFIHRLPYLDCFFISIIACLLILVWRFIFYNIIIKIDLRHRILFLGIDEVSKMVVNEILSDDHPKFKVVGFIANDPSLVGKEIVNSRILGLAKDLDSIIGKEKVTKLIVSYPQGRGNLPSDDLLNCKFKGVEIVELHTFYESFKGGILITGLRSSWLIFSDGFKKTRLVMMWKRIFDIIFSIIGLLLTLPISIITGLLIKWESPGPVIYKQERVGENGRVFILYKFRSMRNDAEKFSGPKWAEENDPRITRVGKFIRMVRIDEIPQMINVLKGDMSFIGPRPERPFFVRELSRLISYYGQRHSIKPGITGWAAVNYRYGSSIEDAREKLQYDFYYIKNMSIFLDLLIILKTIPIILGRKGAR